MHHWLLSLLIFVSQLSIASEVFVERSDSGISGPPYKEILAEMDKLAIEYPGLVTVHQYGQSVKGRPLKLLLVKKSFSLGMDHPTLLMTGSTHGNEYLNIEDRLPREILKLSKTAGPVANFLTAGGAYIFVPILNPDGYETRSRYNANGADLNRDWDVEPANHSGFEEIETRSLADYLRKLTVTAQLDLRITVDYHCCIGALLHPWSYKSSALPKADLAQHQTIGRSAEKLLKVEHGTTPQILGYSPLGTTKDYYYAEYGALAFTYEGRYDQENKHFDKHVNWWIDMSDFALKNHRAVIGIAKKTKKTTQTLAD